jgi:hypothetical protein
MQALNLVSKGSAEVPIRDTRQGDVANDHLVAGKQHGGRQVTSPVFGQEGSVLDAPLRGGAFPETFNGVSSQDASAGGPDPHENHFQIAIADLNPHSRPKGQEIPGLDTPAHRRGHRLRFGGGLDRRH